MHVNMRRQYWRAIEGKFTHINDSAGCYSREGIRFLIFLSKCLQLKGAKLYYFHSLIVVRLHEVENSKQEFVLLLHEHYFPKEDYFGYLPLKGKMLILEVRETFLRLGNTNPTMSKNGNYGFSWCRSAVPLIG